MSKIQAIAALGMQAHQLGIETIANNLANINTTGYKTGRVNFHSLLSPETSGSAADAASSATANANGVLRDFAVGKTKATESAYDVAIQGAGFFAVMLPDGSKAYTRGGSLRINNESFLTTSAGHVLAPSILLPANVAELVIAADGKVMARGADQAELNEVGQLEIATFTNPEGLQALDGGLYRPNELSGDAMPGRPGEDGRGTVAQRRLEGSNVNMVEEMVNLISMQQTFGFLSKVITADEELKQITNNLRKSS
ncbi:MAG TPA: flagellar hook-basal body complex protein [Paucimonas sp.]|nr:flagellar hook-basal body complex protein [Paucimonas sp.]